jgi:RHS repeat-associated protein
MRPPSVTPGPLNSGTISAQVVYDRDSRIVQQIRDDLSTTTTQYDGVSRPVLVTDPVGNTIASTYDADSNLITRVETDISQKAGVASESFTTTNQYDSLDRLTITSDNCQNTRRSAYDSRNNLTDSTDAKGDAALGCSGTMNAQGNSMRYAYDGFNRQLQTTQDLRVGGVGSGAIDTSNPDNPSGQIVTTTTYDADSRLTGMTDNNGNTTTYGYDALNRRTSETLADTTVTTYAYDADDNLIKVTDNNGTVQNHTYDNLNRRVQTAVVPAAGVVGTTLNTYQYDGLSRLTQMTDNNDPSDSTSASTVNMVYDSLGRVVEDAQNGHAIDSSWFAQNRRPNLIYPNGRQVNYTYDALERVQTIQNNGELTKLAQYSYIGTSRVLQRQYQNGTQLTYLDNAGVTDVGYDSLRRTVQHRDLNGSNSLLVGFTYNYDREDNKASENKLHSLTNGELYSYDSAYRVTSFERGQLNGTGTGLMGAPSSTQAWTLDGVGNWRLNTVNGINQSRSVNSTNEYTQIVTPSVSTDNLSYDKNGNLVLSTAGAVAYQWDYKNRLREVCTLAGAATNCSSPGASVVATYAYDAMNRRIRKIVSNSGSFNGTTNFYYDGWQTIEERNGSDTETQQYVYGAVYIDEPITLDNTTGRYFYHQNAIFSTFALTNGGGNIVEGYQYDAYGQQTVLQPDFTTVVGTSSTVGNPYMYTGQRFDPETGLFYYRNRYYSAQLGRFLQRDPLGEDTEINPYTYAADGPTKFVDPMGWQAGPYANTKQEDLIKLWETLVYSRPRLEILSRMDPNSPFAKEHNITPDQIKNAQEQLKKVNQQIGDVGKELDRRKAAACPAKKNPCAILWALYDIAVEYSIVEDATVALQAIADIASLGATAAASRAAKAAGQKLTKDQVMKMIKKKLEEIPEIANLKGGKALLSNILDPEKACYALAECETTLNGNPTFGRQRLNFLGRVIRQCSWNNGTAYWYRSGWWVNLKSWFGAN